ncbi:restriction endonuclease subunit S [Flavobacterium frigidarium]|uniref:Restriction endonuclease subunit S n=1 Tax=Flavobacterium frigidarium TaxID=99286 RepID=A0ABV4K9B1_9FLAO
MLETKKLGEVCKFVRGPFGGSLKKNCFVENGNAVYEQQHAIYNQFSEIRYFINDEKFEEMKRFELKSGDLIMSCSGTMGKVAIVPANIKKGIINQALLKLTPSKNLDIEYLRYWMSSPDFIQRIEENTVGAAIKNVASVKILKEIKVPVPPLQQQQQIVAIINQAFEAIDQAKANIEKNIANAKELFQSKLNEIFSQKDDGWEEKSFKELSTRIGDGLHGTPNYDEDGEYYFINGNNLTNGLIEIKGNTKKVNYEEFIKHKKELNENTVLISINGTLGNVAFYNNEKVILGKSACYINFMPSVNKHFIKYLIKSPIFFKSMANESTGATIKNFSLKSMREYIVNLPPMKIQNEIVQKLELLETDVLEITYSYKQKLNNLEDLKKSILQKAFAGELTNMDFLQQVAEPEASYTKK